MRELAIKNSQVASALSNDKVDDQSEEQIEENPISIKRLFQGWLREVPPRQHPPQSDPDHDNGIRRLFPTTQSSRSVGQLPGSSRNTTTATQKWKILTIREVLGLTRATVRESVEHRTWPPEVVLKFMAAEVVTRKR